MVSVFNDKNWNPTGVGLMGFKQHKMVVGIDWNIHGISNVDGILMA